MSGSTKGHQVSITMHTDCCVASQRKGQAVIVSTDKYLGHITNVLSSRVRVCMYAQSIILDD